MLGLDQLQREAALWSKETRRNLTSTIRDICTRWVREAKLRVPVETGLLRNTILKDQGWEGDEIWGAVGSNQNYAANLEFGTKYIARGRVKAIGPSPDVADAQAVVNWPAKNRDLVDEKTGKANTRALKAIEKRHAAGGRTEQMPWLRPAFNAIRDWAINRLAEALGFGK